jgi:predicted DNA-binding transcriptional regulator AlpA
MAPSDSQTQTGNTPGAAFADAGDLQPLVAKIHRIAHDLEELEGLIALKREHVRKQLSSITLLDREEVGERLSMSTSAVDRASRKGELPRINIDRKPRFAVPDIQAYIDSRRSSGSRRRRHQKP